MFGDDGLITLTIDETFVDDSANWSVRASNPAGYAESHAKLTVQEKIEQFKPKVVKPLKDIAVQESKSLELRCKIESNPLATVSWYKNGICVDRNRNFTIGENSGGENVLRIEKCHLEDHAEFSAIASNSLGSIQTSAKVTIKPEKMSFAPEFINPLNNLEIVIGQSLDLECKLSGTPKPEVTWLHNGKIINNEFVSTAFNGEKATLRVKQAFPKSAGQYVCKAKNCMGEASSTSTVLIKPLAVETSDSEALDNSKQKPAFYVPLKNTKAKEGADVVLECVITGNPEPNVVWFKDNCGLKSSNKVEIFNRGESKKLVLKNVRMENSGEFKVKAINNEGECQSTCVLTVESINLSTGTQTTLNSESYQRIDESSFTERLNIEETEKISYVAQSSVKTKPKKILAPKFLKQVQSKVVDEGQSVVLEVIIDGDPQPKITWLYNDKPVKTGTDVRIQHQDQSTKLIISKLKEAQSGNYSCVAENIGGFDKSAATLVVRKKHLAPILLGRLKPAKVTAGETFVAEIQVGGNPDPNVTWFHDNGKITQGQRIKLFRHGNRHRIVISNVQVSAQYIEFKVPKCGNRTE